MSDESPETFGKAIQALFGIIGFILIMVGTEHFRDNGFSYTDLLYVICGCVCVCAVAIWFTFRRKFSTLSLPVKRLLWVCLILIFSAAGYELAQWCFSPKLEATASANIAPNTDTVMGQSPPSFPERPGLTMSGIEIMYLGGGTAIGPCGGIRPQGKGLLMNNMGIIGPNGMPPSTGIEAGDDSPVLSNGTDIQATHGIKTGNGSSVTTYGGSISPAPTTTNMNRTILYVMGGDGPCPEQNGPTASSSMAPAPTAATPETIGIETGSYSPVVTNGTPIQADHGIKTKDHSPVTTSGGLITAPQH